MSWQLRLTIACWQNKFPNTIYSHAAFHFAQQEIKKHHPLVHSLLRKSERMGGYTYINKGEYAPSQREKCAFDRRFDTHHPLTARPICQ